LYRSRSPTSFDQCSDVTLQANIAGEGIRQRRQGNLRYGPQSILLECYNVSWHGKSNTPTNSKIGGTRSRWRSNKRQPAERGFRTNGRPRFCLPPPAELPIAASQRRTASLKDRPLPGLAIHASPESEMISLAN
jgi:hypothetical protein